LTASSQLRALFAILATSDLALNQEKCVFAVSELNFLVHRISAADVAPLRENPQFPSLVLIADNVG
jgi:hypothetical protein